MKRNEMPILKRMTDGWFEFVGLDFTNNHLWGRQSNKRHSYNFKCIKRSVCVCISVHIGTYLIALLWFLQFSRICIILEKCVHPLCIYMYIIYNIIYIIYYIIIIIISNKGQKKVNEMYYNFEIFGSQGRAAESSVLVLWTTSYKLWTLIT